MFSNNKLSKSNFHSWPPEKSARDCTGGWLKQTNILLMAEIDELLLRLVVYPVIYRVLAPSQVVVWDF